MKKFSCSVVISCAALSSAMAADAPAPANPEANRASAPTIELKNKSSFSIDENGRNPFWPIGWKPAAKITTNTSDHIGPDISPNSFLVSSIVMDPKAKFAIVNGKVMSEGQVFG